MNKPVVPVGKVKEAHGLKGELFIFIFSKETSFAQKVKNFYLSPERDLRELTDQTPFKQYQATHFRPYKEAIIAASPNLPDRTAAEQVLGQFVYVDSEVFTSKKGETIFLSEILGFEVFDHKTRVGVIKGFSSNGPQDLLLVESETQSFEIPFVESFTKKIKFSERQIEMSLPEGLLEINTENASGPTPGQNQNSIAKPKAK